MNGEPKIVCVECSEEVEVGEWVIPISIFDGTPEVRASHAIHLKCLVTQSDGREIRDRAVATAAVNASGAMDGLGRRY